MRRRDVQQQRLQQQLLQLRHRKVRDGQFLPQRPNLQILHMCSRKLLPLWHGDGVGHGVPGRQLLHRRLDGTTTVQRGVRARARALPALRMRPVTVRGRGLAQHIRGQRRGFLQRVYVLAGYVLQQWRHFRELQELLLYEVLHGRLSGGDHVRHSGLLVPVGVGVGDVEPVRRGALRHVGQRRQLLVVNLRVKRLQLQFGKLLSAGEHLLQRRYVPRRVHVRRQHR